MTEDHGLGLLFLGMLGIIAVAGIVTGTVLAVSGYSSAGPFAVASACVGVLGTLASQRALGNGHHSDPPHEVHDG